ncbi:MAG: hypothetical protein L3J46_02705 [Kangiellaceae bacterium]|nr:hypothetical protein [Kangiellaceae bacterium]
MKRINIPLLTILLMCVFFSHPSFAMKNKQEKDGEKKQYQCRLISRGSAISQAKRRTKGKVVGVQQSGQGRRAVYRVRVLVNKKRIKTITIPACR